MTEDAVLTTLATFDGPVAARTLAARLYETDEQTVIRDGRSAEIAKVCIRLVAQQLAFKDYPYGVHYTAYGLTPAGQVRAEHLALPDARAA